MKINKSHREANKFMSISQAQHDILKERVTKNRYHKKNSIPVTLSLCMSHENHLLTGIAGLPLHDHRNAFKYITCSISTRCYIDIMTQDSGRWCSEIQFCHKIYAIALASGKNASQCLTSCKSKSGRF